jgi:L-threonylcarbamoyladenylate synthase
VIAEAAAILAAGRLVAFATETVYGLGADATVREAVGRIFEAKGRPAQNPLIVHVSSIAMARECVADWPDVAERLARTFWPGPLTLVLPKAAIIPSIVTAGLETVGIRMPRTAVALAVLSALGRPIAAPSANRSTRLSPTTAQHVAKDLGGCVDLILDSGPTHLGLESTVLDLSRGVPYRILRPGPVLAYNLEREGGFQVEQSQSPAAGERLTSPGQMPVHYAPRTPLEWVEPDKLREYAWPARAACLIVGPAHAIDIPGSIRLAHLETPEAAARALYATLHAWDEQELERIVVVPPPDQPEWAAVRDRLTRAASAMSE